jgi:hypothetical protein
MRVSLLAMFAVVAAASPVAAQPAMTPPSLSFEPTISPDDRDVLDGGEISTGRIIGGTIASTLVGFGTGQLIEGRYSSTGWIFTVGESVSTVALFTGLMGVAVTCDAATTHADVCHRGAAVGLLLGGALGFLGFRGWDIADAGIAPLERNARYRAALRRNPTYAARVMPFVTPVEHGTTAGLSVSF